MLSECAGLDQDLSHGGGVEVDQPQRNTLWRDLLNEGSDVGRKAGPAAVRVKIADWAMQQAAVINVVRRAKHGLDQPFKDNRVPLLPMVDVALRRVGLIGPDQFQATERLGIGSLEDSSWIVRVLTFHESEPVGLVPEVAFGFAIVQWAGSRPVSQGVDPLVIGGILQTRPRGEPGS